MIKLLLAAFLIQAPQTIHLPGGTVTGVLRTNQGAPMSAVRVAAIPADGTDPGSVLQGIAQTDSDGRYRIENVPPGRYHIMAGRIASPLYLPGVQEIRLATTIVVTDGSTTQVADMVYFRVRVAGRVIDASTGLGRRIESLSICCEYAQYASPGISARFGISEVSRVLLMTPVNDDGTFEFSAVPEGNQYLQVFDSTIASFNLPLTVTNTDITGVELKVSRGSEIRGNVVDRTGRDVGGVSVRLQPREGNRAYELRYKPTGGLAVYSGAALPSGASPLNPTNDDILARLQSEAGTRAIPIGPNGSFIFSGVLPGAYVIDILTPSGRSEKREIVVGSQTSTLQIEVPLTQLSGKVVVKDGGTPPALKDSIRIFLYGPNGETLFFLPDADGRFYQLLPPGEYRVSTQSLTRDYHVQSISDGSHDLLVQPLVFDGVSSPEMQVTLVESP